MADYQQLTPAPRARGRYTVRLPFRVAADVDYTCIAIRTFTDMYRERVDPYTTVYEPAGLIDNTTNDGRVFNYAEESNKGINIITLVDDLGNHILVPDNYITGMPTSSSIQYLEFIASVSLGALPSTFETSTIEQAIIDAVGAQTGIEATVKIHTLATTTNPTYEEHLVYEQARQTRVILGSSSSATIKSQEAQIELLNAKVEALTKLAQDNNILPT